MTTDYKVVKTFKVFQPHKASTSYRRVDACASRKAHKLHVLPFMRKTGVKPSDLLLDFHDVDHQDFNNRKGSTYTFRLLQWTP